MEHMHPDDYDLDAVRGEWIGKLISEARGRYPVEYDPIRRHCHMVGDLNPAFLDPEVAAQGPHGAVIVPPSMLPTYFAAEGPWPPTAAAGTDAETTAVFSFGVPTPGDRGINMEVAWEFLEPIRVGDLLRLELRIADVFQKAISLDPHAVWIITETSFFNQDDMIVAKWRNTMLIHRSPEQVSRDAQRGTVSGEGA